MSKSEISKAVEQAREEPKKEQESKATEDSHNKLISQQQALIKERTETLQRLQAEFENYKKRSEKECCDFRKFAEVGLIKELLPTLDSFEIAIKNHSKDDIKGFELIYAQLYSMLEKKGLRKIEALKKPFDPYMHEVLLTEKNEKEKDNIVTEELQTGYLFCSQVIRTSKVKVNKL